MAESHIVGLDVEIGPYLRQRCGWCGTILLDYDLRNVMVQQIDGEDESVGTWPVGEVIRVDGNMSSIVEHTRGDQLPEDNCAALDPSVTR